MGKVQESLFLIGLCSLAIVSAEDISNQVRQGKIGFPLTIPGLGGTTNLLSTLAQDLISRSTTSSQVNYNFLNLCQTKIIFKKITKKIAFRF